MKAIHILELIVGYACCGVLTAIWFDIPDCYGAESGFFNFLLWPIRIGVAIKEHFKS